VRSVPLPVAVHQRRSPISIKLNIRLQLVLEQFNFCINIVLTVFTACSNRYVSFLPETDQDTRSCTLVSHRLVFRRITILLARCTDRTVLSFRRSGQSPSGRPWHHGMFRKHANGRQLTNEVRRIVQRSVLCTFLVAVLHLN